MLLLELDAGRRVCGVVLSGGGSEFGVGATPAEADSNYLISQRLVVTCSTKSVSVMINVSTYFSTGTDLGLCLHST